MYKKQFEEEYAKMILSPICVDEQGQVHFVDGEGPMDSEIVFIGEAPGEKEDREKRPFVGAAGKLLEELLAAIGLKREQVYITNIVKCRPPGNRDPLPEEIEAGLAYLNKEIEAIKPKLIVFLGRHSLNTFFPDQRISKVHGKPFRQGNQVYLPVYHPAAALYRPENKKDLLEDFMKIPKIIKKITEESSKQDGDSSNSSPNNGELQSTLF